jgi:hypothetical protein
MKLPLTIGRKIQALPQDFRGSITVHTNGHGEWKLEISQHEREKDPARWCEVVELSRDQDTAAVTQ